VLHPFFVVFFFLKSIDLSRFICCGRRMRTDQDEEKASKSGFRLFHFKLQKCPFERILTLKISTEAIF